MVSMAAIKPVADTAQLNAFGFDMLGPFLMHTKKQ